MEISLSGLASPSSQGIAEYQPFLNKIAKGVKELLRATARLFAFAGLQLAGGGRVN